MSVTGDLKAAITWIHLQNKNALGGSKQAKRTNRSAVFLSCLNGINPFLSSLYPVENIVALLCICLANLGG